MTRGWTIGLALVLMPMLAACDLGGAGERAEAEKQMQASIRGILNEDLPAGFTIAAGTGGVRELSVTVAGNSTNASYSTLASPRAIMTHYRREAEAAGMTYAGQLESNDMLVTNFQRTDPRPRTLSVSALQKGEYTNVTLAFDIGG